MTQPRVLSAVVHKLDRTRFLSFSCSLPEKEGRKERAFRPSHLGARSGGIRAETSSPQVVVFRTRARPTDRSTTFAVCCGNLARCRSSASRAPLIANVFLPPSLISPRRLTKRIQSYCCSCRCSGWRNRTKMRWMDGRWWVVSVSSLFTWLQIGKEREKEKRSIIPPPFPSLPLPPRPDQTLNVELPLSFVCLATIDPLTD